MTASKPSIATCRQARAPLPETSPGSLRFPHSYLVSTLSESDDRCVSWNATGPSRIGRAPLGNTARDTSPLKMSNSNSSRFQKRPLTAKGGDRQPPLQRLCVVRSDSRLVLCISIVSSIRYLDVQQSSNALERASSAAFQNALDRPLEEPS